MKLAAPCPTHDASLPSCAPLLRRGAATKLAAPPHGPPCIGTAAELRPLSFGEAPPPSSPRLSPMPSRERPSPRSPPPSPERRALSRLRRTWEAERHLWPACSAYRQEPSLGTVLVFGGSGR